MEAVLTLGLVSVILGTASGAQNIGIILVGGFAEAATYVKQRRSRSKGDRGLLVFEIVTGFPEGQSSFAAHGHTVRVSVAGVF
jgi:hypothetical protein